MDNTNNTVPQRMQLKKVKRPINRMPQSASVMPPAAAESQRNAALSSDPAPAASAPRQVAVETDAFNLDSYLDAEDNLPVKASAAPVVNNQPRFVTEEPPAEEEAYAPMASDLPPYLTKKVLILIGAVLLFVGVLIGKVFIADSKVVRNGLQGVVMNPEVPRGRARCGVAERTQGCVLYVMNPQRQDLIARDFYDIASQMTGRQRFVIETGNMRYSNTKIRPGEIVQLNIPPL